MKKVIGVLFIAILSCLGAAAQSGNSYYRPQKPIPPFPYRTEEVQYQNALDTAVHFAATLTLPEGKGPFPAVLMLGGSGQFPRDHEFYGHNSDLVLADHLTRLGIATLRFDERGTGKSTRGSKQLRDLVEEDHFSDARAGIDFLRSRPEIDIKKIGVIGSSAGTLYAQMLATQTPEQIAFVVMMAAAPASMTKGDIVARQSSMMLQVEKASANARLADSTFIAKSLYYTKNEPDREKRFKAIQAVAQEELSKLSAADRAHLEEGFKAKVDILSSELFHQDAHAERKDYLSAIQCPILAINGGKDVLIDAYYTVPLLRASLQSGTNRDYQVQLMPQLNHMMQRAKTGLMEECEQIEESFAPDALALIGTWVVDHTFNYKGVPRKEKKSKSGK